ncbi:hypothetical protein ADUPG1_010517 [Aduncisulcus paluster]|uniref:Uncharacterized protein n=1 Tax=Aduncisulcus paluster TaxID=2918883 RepID=A0ABQ5JVV6_9EUKA|nr:hypothetical protein ADUPG1_010517 [Aduncisulcus paluster]
MGFHQTTSRSSYSRHLSRSSLSKPIYSIINPSSSSSTPLRSITSLCPLSSKHFGAVVNPSKFSSSIIICDVRTSSHPIVQSCDILSLTDQPVSSLPPKYCSQNKTYCMMKGISMTPLPLFCKQYVSTIKDVKESIEGSTATDRSSTKIHGSQSQDKTHITSSSVQTAIQSSIPSYSGIPSFTTPQFSKIFYRRDNVSDIMSLSSSMCGLSVGMDERQRFILLDTNGDSGVVDIVAQSPDLFISKRAEMRLMGSNSEHKLIGTIFPPSSRMCSGLVPADPSHVGHCGGDCSAHRNVFSAPFRTMGSICRSDGTAYGAGVGIRKKNGRNFSSCSFASGVRSSLSFPFSSHSCARLLLAELGGLRSSQPVRKSHFNIDKQNSMFVHYSSFTQTATFTPYSRIIKAFKYLNNAKRVSIIDEDQSTSYQKARSKFCVVPKSTVNLGANVEWIFGDGIGMDSILFAKEGQVYGAVE